MTKLTKTQRQLTINTKAKVAFGKSKIFCNNHIT